MQKTTRIDFHMHSSASDGKLSPKALAEECFSLGLTHVALTDHDTILGQKEFLSTAETLGLCALSGIELNCDHTRELHLLGYGFDIHDSALNATLNSLSEHRLTRAQRILDALAQHGYALEMERIREIAGEGVIGRPHIAKALVEKGYVHDVPQAFRKLLGKGCPGEVPRYRISHKDAIRLIRDAGGKVVLAHPGCMWEEDHEALVKTLKDEGLQGIEAFYPEHKAHECQYFCELAEKYGLFITQGSDYHGGVGRSAAPGMETRGTETVSANFEKIF